MVGSYLPSDRVFARIEKVIKRKEVISQPEEYIDIFKDHGTVISLNNIVKDWKSASSLIIKPPGQWHLQKCSGPTFGNYQKR